MGFFFSSYRLNSNYISNPIFIKSYHNLVIHFFPNENSTSKVVEKEIVSIIKKYSRSTWWRIRARLLVGPFLATMIFVGVILFFLGILHTFEESIFEMARTLVEGDHEIGVYLLIALLTWLLISFFLFFSPATLKVEDINPREKISDWLSGEQRVSKRISFYLNYLIKKNIINRIDIWNPESLSQGTLALLLDRATAGGIPVFIYFSCSEKLLYIKKFKDQFKDQLNECHLNSCYSTNAKFITKMNINDKKNNLENINSDNILYRMNLLNDYEMHLLPLFVVCSVQINEDQFLISSRLMQVMANHLNLLKDGLDSEVVRFYERFIGDYGLAFWSRGILSATSATISTLRSHEAVANRIASIQPILDKIIDDSFLLDQFDSLACIVLVNHIVGHNFRYQKVRRAHILFEQAIDIIKREEAYFMTPVIKNLVSRFSFYSVSFPDAKKPSGIFDLSSCVLDSILIIYERFGDFKSALDVANTIKSIDNEGATIKISRLYERLGRYDEAFKMISSIPENNICANNSVRSALYLIEYAWILVCLRKHGTNDLVREKLTKAYKIIDKLDRSESQLPILLWRFWNISYNLYEWEEQYVCALVRLEYCLVVPGIDLKWRSGTYVNMGIAYRNISGIDVDLKKKKENLLKALRYGRRGFFIKIRLGDFDEVPLSAYHFSKSLFEFWKINPLCQGRLLSSLTLIIYGKRILDKHSSVKKKDVLDTMFEFILQQINLNERHEYISKAELLASQLFRVYS